jgi:hypothetical protein
MALAGRAARGAAPVTQATAAMAATALTAGPTRLPDPVVTAVPVEIEVLPELADKVA